MSEIEKTESEKKEKVKRKKEQKEKQEEINQQTEVSSAVTKMKLVAALSTACSQKTIIDAFSKIEFGEQMLSIFAEAIEKKIEQLFSGNDISRQQADIKIMTDDIYAKIREVGDSPLMTVLMNLARNISDGGVQTPKFQKQNGLPGMNAQDALLHKMYANGGEAPLQADVESFIQNSSLGF